MSKPTRRQPVVTQNGTIYYQQTKAPNYFPASTSQASWDEGTRRCKKKALLESLPKDMPYLEKLAKLATIDFPDVDPNNIRELLTRDILRTKFYLSKEEYFAHKQIFLDLFAKDRLAKEPLDLYLKTVGWMIAFDNSAILYDWESVEELDRQFQAADDRNEAFIKTLPTLPVSELVRIVEDSRLSGLVRDHILHHYKMPIEVLVRLMTGPDKSSAGAIAFSQSLHGKEDLYRAIYPHLNKVDPEIRTFYLQVYGNSKFVRDVNSMFRVAGAVEKNKAS